MGQDECPLHLPARFDGYAVGRRCYLDLLLQRRYVHPAMICRLAEMRADLGSRSFFVHVNHHDGKKFAKLISFLSKYCGTASGESHCSTNLMA